MIKKNFIIIFVILAGAVFGIFLFGSGKKVFYVKNDFSGNSNVYSAAIADKPVETEFPDVPKIAKNLTSDLAQKLGQKIINENSSELTVKTTGEPAGDGLIVPNPEAIAEEFIKNGLKQASENILNIAPIQLKISSDNNKETVTAYLLEIKNIINSNLTGVSLLDLLEEINKNNGQGVEKLLPIISAHEVAANQIEAVPIPSDLKNLITEEIRLLRITANVLRPFLNIENDPLAVIAATQQFGIIVGNWNDLQNKFNVFIQKLNQM